MTKNIPENQIMKAANYGHISGDIAESFGIDISSSYGSIRASKRMKLIDKPTAMQVPLDFAYYNSKYYFCSDSFMYVGGNSPEDGFSKDVSSGAPTGIDNETGNIEVFNGDLYVVEGSDVVKLSGSTWSNPATLVGITGGTGNHMMKVFGNKLYITYDSVKVLSITTADAVADADTPATQFAADWVLGSGWTPTFLDVAQGSLWIGYLNTRDGRGIVIQWDGDTADTYTKRIELEAGVIAGCVLDNIPYIVDIRGRLKAYSGSKFVEVERLNLGKNQALEGVRSATTIDRPIHPNGMIPTEDGNIMFLFKNTLTGGSVYEDTVPSGVYEYNQTTGLTHRHSLSLVDMDNTTLLDYGQQRLVYVGALHYRQPNQSPFENGALLAGAKYHTDGVDVGEEYGVWGSDEFDTTQKYGYIITKKIFGDGVQDTWSKIYTIYKEFVNSTDKIVVKYRTEEDIPTEFEISWTDTNEFVSTEDLSAYGEGDEVQVLIAGGAGKSAHITSIEKVGANTTVILDDTFTGATGTAKINLSKWIKLGEITEDDDLQFKELTIDGNNKSPYIQFKTCMEWTGKNEIYKQKVVNKVEIK